ncbi:MAG TPA: plastocyanin/azurin family copper-binding protein [Gemmatimonadales bacterium]
MPPVARWLLLAVVALPACRSDPTGPADGHAIAVSDDKFSPISGNIPAGDTVTWTWMPGNDGHNVTFEDSTVGASGDLVAGTWRRGFATPGYYRYRCTLHSTNFASGMVGVIVVH